ncbi:MAG: hypothetical protein ACRC42_00315 [Mycoplasma sp.]
MKLNKRIIASCTVLGLFVTSSIIGLSLDITRPWEYRGPEIINYISKVTIKEDAPKNDDLSTIESHLKTMNSYDLWLGNNYFNLETFPGSKSTIRELEESEIDTEFALKDASYNKDRTLINIIITANQKFDNKYRIVSCEEGKPFEYNLSLDFSSKESFITIKENQPNKYNVHTIKRYLADSNDLIPKNKLSEFVELYHFPEASGPTANTFKFIKSEVIQGSFTKSEPPFSVTFESQFVTDKDDVIQPSPKQFTFTCVSSEILDTTISFNAKHKDTKLDYIDFKDYLTSESKNLSRSGIEIPRDNLSKIFNVENDMHNTKFFVNKTEEIENEDGTLINEVYITMQNAIVNGAIGDKDLEPLSILFKPEDTSYDTKVLKTTYGTQEFYDNYVRQEGLDKYAQKTMEEFIDFSNLVRGIEITDIKIDVKSVIQESDPHHEVTFFIEKIYKNGKRVEQPSVAFCTIKIIYDVSALTY